MTWYDGESPQVGYEGGAVFIRRCPNCGRFIKADQSVTFRGRFGEPEEVKDQPNADCKKCGRVQMMFLGWFDLDA